MTLTIIVGALPSMSFGFDFSNLSSIEPMRFGAGGHDSVTLNPDGTILAAERNGVVYFWDLRTLEELESWAVGPNVFGSSIAFSSNWKTLVFNDIRPGEGMDVWDVVERKKIGVLETDPGVGHGNITLSPDGRILASTGWLANEVLLWDTQTLEQTGSIQGLGKSKSLTFSPDGRLLVIRVQTDDGGAIRLWDIASQSQVGQLIGSTGGTSDLSFSPDGRLLASVGETDGIKSVYLWDFESQDLIGVLGSYEPPIGSIAFSPDGKFLAFDVYWDTTIHLWDVERQEEIGVLTGHRPWNVGWEGGLVSSPDGKWLVGGSVNGVELWKFEPDVDLSNDGAVDIDDLSRLIESWGMNDPLVDIGPMPWGDGIVDAKDVLVLAEYMVENASDVDDTE
jgi:WD40 repeat protein